jgi:hypothetical protein
LDTKTSTFILLVAFYSKLIHSTTANKHDKDVLKRNILSEVLCIRIE